MLTSAQQKKYWRTWAAICACQGWADSLTSAQKNLRRKGTHLMCGLKNEDGSARSMKSFGNRDFSRWLAATAHLRDEVDIRDRDRENAVWTVERLAAAFETILGHDYARSIKIDWRDTADLDKFPLEDPLRYLRDEHGKIDPRDAGRMRDLENLRNTLKNRLGRIIQRVKNGEIQPGPDCPNFYDYTQDFIISRLVNGRPIPAPEKLAADPAESAPTSTAPQQRRKYVLNSGTSQFSAPSKEGLTMTPRQGKPATVTGPIPVARPASLPSSFCTHATPHPATTPPAVPHPQHAHHAGIHDENEPF